MLASSICISYKPCYNGSGFAATATASVKPGQPVDQGAIDEPVGVRLHEDAMTALSMRNEMRRLVHEVNSAIYLSALVHATAEQVQKLLMEVSA